MESIWSTSTLSESKGRMRGMAPHAYSTSRYPGRIQSPRFSSSYNGDNPMMGFTLTTFFPNSVSYPTATAIRHFMNRLRMRIIVAPTVATTESENANIHVPSNGNGVFMP